MLRYSMIAAGGLPEIAQKAGRENQCYASGAMRGGIIGSEDDGLQSGRGNGRLIGQPPDGTGQELPAERTARIQCQKIEIVIIVHRIAGAHARRDDEARAAETKGIQRCLSQHQ
jgi:hypothetical protein